MSTLSLALSALVALTGDPAPATFELRPGDRVCLLGNALAERMQHHGHLETRLQLRFPEHHLSFRNLGFSGDELGIQQRTAGFGSWDDYLQRCQADVIFAFFGFNESFADEAGLPAFRQQLADFLTHQAAQRHQGTAAPRMVLFTAPPFENAGRPELPDGVEHNRRLRAYNGALAEVGAAHGATVVDLFAPMAAAQAGSPEPLTLNGVFLTDPGNAVLAEVIETALFGAPAAEPSTGVVAAVRAAVLDKNLLWFNRYRATDGYNVYGGRASLKYTDDVSNYDVLQREMQILDAMAADGDRAIWARVAGDLTAVPDHSGDPAPLPVKTNIPGPLPDGRHEFLDGEAAIASMKVAAGMRVNLFADEKQFPAIANPVQMSWDTRGRLWVATWPTYPHWAPGWEMNDKLVILEDTDGDGRADRCTPFASDLHNPTGFEFWNGGVVVANAPDLLFLEDTDGDDRADRRTRLLHGLSSADTHHSANSFVLGPDGALYFQEGTFHMSQIETPYGPERCHNACVWRFDPRTFQVERHIAYNFANPHGHVFDHWGQEFVTDGTGNVNYYALPFSGRVIHPDKHSGYFPFFQQRSRPCAGTEILSSSHFPPENQGNYLICNVIGFRGIFQYAVEDDGAGFRATEVEPIVSSEDARFRPADVEVGPDGALYFLDWYNPIIGHMQHHLRDPNRDREHGRVYRVTCEGRPLVSPRPVHGEPIPALLDLLKEPDDRVRYRARIELSARDSGSVHAALERWVAGLPPADPDLEHHLLEALWVHQQHRRVPADLLDRVLRSPDARARAAAVTVLRQVRDAFPEALARLRPMVADPHPRVRLAAVVAASAFDDAEAAALALEALRQPTDRFLDYALNETMRTLAPWWKAALTGGEPLASDNPAGIAFLLERVNEEELMHLPPLPIVHQAMLERHGVSAERRREAADALAIEHGTDAVQELLVAIQHVDRKGGMHARHVLHDLGQLLERWLTERPRDPALLWPLARTGQHPEARQLALAAIASQSGDLAAIHAAGEDSPERLQDFLGAVGLLSDDRLRASAYDLVRPLMFGRPTARDGDGNGHEEAVGLRASFYPVRLRDASIETFRALQPEATRIVPAVTLPLPDLTPPDSFAVLFEGTLHVPEAGEYRFFTTSDDGSRLYLDGQVVVDNDGDHGMQERSGVLHLAAGPHELWVTFFDQAGAEGLSVAWQPPGQPKQPLPPERLSTRGADPVRVAAIRAMATVPGHEREKFQDAALLIQEGVLVDAAVALLDQTPDARLPAAELSPLIDCIAAYAAGLPAEQRTLPGVLAALEAGRRLASHLPGSASSAALERLSALGGTTVLIRTVPHQMLYDRREFYVEAGQPVAIVFQNNDVMPHNLVVTRPGTMESVGMAAEALGAEAGARGSNFIPAGDDVLWFVRLLYPGETADLRFVAPGTPGDYPYVCTFPGHWRVMNGVMHVVRDLDPSLNRSSAPVTVSDAAPVRKFVRMWAPEDLADAFPEDWERGRSLARGRALYEDAGCIKCHWFQGRGVKSAPDLTEIRTKYRGADLLRQILEPSAKILEGYESHVVFTLDGKTVIGRIVLDDARGLHVVPNLQEPDKVEIVAHDNVELTKQSTLSAMPTGLLVTFERDEILDLLAYLQSVPR